MALVQEISVLDYLHLTSYYGTFAGSQGVTDTSSSLVEANVSFINSVPVDTTANVKPTYNTYYRMQGYNPLTGKYEDWHSMNEPLMSPPSGHALLDVTIVTSWIDR